MLTSVHCEESGLFSVKRSPLEVTRLIGEVSSATSTAMISPCDHKFQLFPSVVWESVLKLIVTFVNNGVD